MIKKVAIVPFVTNGRNSQAGHDGHMLIPEDIVSYIDYTNINKKEECYKLSSDEYENGEPTKVVEYIKRVNGS